MKSIFKATAILSSSSVVSVVVGLISAKFMAKMIGPSGIGYLAMLQGFLSLATMVSGLGIPTGTVKIVSKSIADDDSESVASNQKAAILLSLASGIATLFAIVIFRHPLNRLMLDNQGDWYEVSLLGVGLIFLLLSNCFVGIVNAHHNVKALAQIAIGNNILNVAFLILFVWLFGAKGLTFGIVSGAFCNFLLGFYFYNKKIPTIKICIPLNKLFSKLRSLLKFGVPFMVSLVVGTGIQFLLPLLILHNLDLENVGFYRAAAAISTMSLSVLLNSMAQDYYPRISRINDNPKLLIETVNEQLYFALLVFSPIILWLQVLSPKLVLLLYTAQFSKTSEILNIILIGEVFKLLGWLLGFIILVNNKSVFYFLSELTFGVILLLASYVGIQYLGVIGAGVGYVTAYFCYFCIVWYFVKRDINITFTLKNKLLILYVLTSAGSVFVLLNFFPSYITVGISVALCLVSSVGSIIYFKNSIYAEKRSSKNKFTSF